MFAALSVTTAQTFLCPTESIAPIKIFEIYSPVCDSQFDVTDLKKEGFLLK
jgi:hypothetical protein